MTEPATLKIESPNTALECAACGWKGIVSQLAPTPRVGRFAAGACPECMGQSWKPTPAACPLASASGVPCECLEHKA